MAQRCKVCSHTKLKEINTQLVKGATLEMLSQKYNVTISALYRHKQNHIPVQLAKAQEAKAVTAADTLLGRIGELDARADDVYTRALEDDNLAAAIGAIKELRAILELYAKLTGELQTQNVNTIIVMPEWVKLRSAILCALQAYPEARQAVVEALGRVEP